MNLTKTSTKKHRTTPVEETISHIANYPDKLVIFQISASKFWWVRYYTQGRILKKSTKTESKKIAIEFAKTFYEDILLRERKNLPLKSSPTFERCADELIAEQEERVLRGELNSRLNLNDKSILKTIKKHFSGVDIRTITYKHINTYLAYLSQKKIDAGTDREKNISSATLKKHLTLISKILKYALREDIIDRIPLIPTIQIKDSSRGWFTEKEYEYLKDTIAEIVNADEQHYVRGNAIDYEIQHLVWFMTATFLRPSDIKILRHRNIQIVKDEFTYLRIYTDKSKTRNDPVVSMSNAIRIYESLIKEHRKREISCKSEDFVFLPGITREKDRWKVMDIFGRQFSYILNLANLKKTATGEERTLYSLRHTAIMFRLTKGDNIDLITLARNARTSVDVIDRFYAGPLRAEMNIDKIQSMRKKSTKTGR